MKKSGFVLMSFLLTVFIVTAQNQGISNNWLLGFESQSGTPYGMTRWNFYSGTLSITQDSILMGFDRTEATISDTNGNMLFYSNGFDIADSTDQIMQNGDSISPSAVRSFFPPGHGLSVSQANLIIPKPNSSNLYYLFHSTLDSIVFYYYALKLYYSIIDMNGNGGKGSVISKNNVLLSDTLVPGRIVACRHGNGRDWWITCFRANSNLIYSYLLTPSGINGPYSQNIGFIKGRGAGQCKFSKKGDKFAYFFANYIAHGDLEIFDFDRCTGQFSNPVYILIPQSQGYGGGVEFSNNDNLLYTANIDSVYQFDLTSSNIAASKVIVAAWDSTYSPQPPFATLFDNMMSGPDGKIYISTGNGTFHVHVINYPDNLGLACDLQQHAIQLPVFYLNGLPNHPNYFLGRDTGSVCDTITVWMGEQNYPPLETKIKVLSNPNNGKFTLWFTVHDKPGWLEVFDVNGNLVFKEGVAQWSQYKQVDIRKELNGIYFVRISWLNGEGNVKVIKQ